MIGILLFIVSVVSAPSQDLAIIEYSAPWCHVCNEMKPLVKSAQAAGYNLVVANIDQKQYDSFPGRNSHDSIPFFVVVDTKSKKVLAVSPPGSMEPQEFKNFVRKYLKPKEKK